MIQKKNVLIFIVSYNAELFIQSVLKRIPEKIWNNADYDISVLIVDDQSSDNTFHRAIDYTKEYPHQDITVLHNPVNQGYGGNQKIGYYYALKNNFDLVVLLHGDGQYAPECLDDMIMPIIKDEADIVFGSRMIHKSNALRGGMPLYKWIGNQVLTTIQNSLLGSHLSEFHTGYRAYSTNALRKIPFSFNSDYFDFDTDIIIQALNTRQRITEISIPTYYGGEISYVNGLKYAALIVLTTIQSKLMKFGVFYTPKFDYDYTNEHYTAKVGYASSHQFALDAIKPGMTVLDIGSGPGYLTEHITNKGVSVVSMDRYIHPLLEEKSIRTIKANLEEYKWTSEDTRVDAIFLLDIIEHLRKPDSVLRNLRDACMKKGNPNWPKFVITTPNVAFWPVRLGLLFGWFHYGKKGILDKDHHRLFTPTSLANILKESGYEIISMRGIPAPYPVALGDNLLSRLLLSINSGLIFLSMGFFSYQIGVVARPKPTLDYLLATAEKTGREKADLYLKN